MQLSTNSNASSDRGFFEVQEKTMSENKPSSPRTIDFFPLVLVVEKDDDTRLMMNYLLKLWKYRVIEAKDAGDAAQLAEQHRPALILMNVEWDNDKSLTNSRRMRELSAFDGATIILISTPVEPETRTSALAAASDFLVKPIDFGKLEKLLEKYLRRDAGKLKEAVV